MFVCLFLQGGGVGGVVWFSLFCFGVFLFNYIKYNSLVPFCITEYTLVWVTF